MVWWLLDSVCSVLDRVWVQDPVVHLLLRLEVWLGLQGRTRFESFGFGAVGKKLQL